MARGNVTAFQLGGDSRGASHPVSFGVVPGEWVEGEPVLASAFGMTDDQMRAAIEAYGLPLEEVHVQAGKAAERIPTGSLRFLSEQDVPTLPVPAAAAVIETKDGPIPSMAPVANHPPLQPITAALQAAATARFRGGTAQDAADAAAAAAGDDAAGLEVARLAQFAADDQARVEVAVEESDYAAPVSEGEES